METVCQIFHLRIYTKRVKSIFRHFIFSFSNQIPRTIFIVIKDTDIIRIRKSRRKTYRIRFNIFSSFLFKRTNESGKKLFQYLFFRQRNKQHQADILLDLRFDFQRYDRYFAAMKTI